MAERVLHTREEIRAAGEALGALRPPLTDEGIERLAVILAPIGDMRRAERERRKGAA